MSTDILGDNSRSRRFDPGLAERLNKDYEIESKKEVIKGNQNIEPEYDDSEIKSDPKYTGELIDGLVMDLYATMSSTKKNHSEWTNYFNDISEAYDLASMRLLYMRFRQAYDNINCADISKAMFAEEFCKDFRKTIRFVDIVTNTSILYFSNSNNIGGIIQDGVSKNIYIPPTQPIKDMLKWPGGQEYVRTLLGTKDDDEKIMQVLEFISQRGRKDIMLYTESLPAKATNIQYFLDRQVTLRYFNGTSGRDIFGIDASIPEPVGYAYGVRHRSPEVKP